MRFDDLIPGNTYTFFLVGKENECGIIQGQRPVTYRFLERTNRSGIDMLKVESEEGNVFFIVASHITQIDGCFDRPASLGSATVH